MAAKAQYRAAETADADQSAPEAVQFACTDDVLKVAASEKVRWADLMDRLA